MPTCNSCGEYCETFADLADHVLEAKHKAGRKWALKYKARVNNTRPLFERQPLSDEQKEARGNCFRTLSGQTEAVKVMCIKCKEVHHQALPIEYTRSPDAWRNGGIFFRLCNFCGGE